MLRCTMLVSLSAVLLKLGSRSLAQSAELPGTFRLPSFFRYYREICCMPTARFFGEVMNRHSRLTNHVWLPLGGAAVTTAILGTMALMVARRARQAERDNPPTGSFLDIEGLRLHYLERGEGPPLVLLHGNGAMVQDFEI